MVNAIQFAGIVAEQSQAKYVDIPTPENVTSQDTGDRIVRGFQHQLPTSSARQRHYGCRLSDFPAIDLGGGIDAFGEPMIAGRAKPTIVALYELSTGMTPSMRGHLSLASVDAGDLSQSGCDFIDMLLPDITAGKSLSAWNAIEHGAAQAARSILHIAQERLDLSLHKKGVREELEDAGGPELSDAAWSIAVEIVRSMPELDEPVFAAGDDGGVELYYRRQDCSLLFSIRANGSIAIFYESNNETAKWSFSSFGSRVIDAARLGLRGTD